MPAVFLYVFSELGEMDLDRVELAARRQLPFEAPPARRIIAAREPRAAVLVWRCGEEAARGDYVHHDVAHQVTTCFDGWLVEEGPLGESVASALHARLLAQGFVEGMATLEGGCVAGQMDAEGVWRGARDLANAQHLYYGERGGVVACSNRAMVVGSALSRGGEPELVPDYFAWWLSASMSPITHHPSPWRHVRQLEAGHYIKINQCNIKVFPLPSASPYASWEEAREAFVRRCTQFTRLPGLPTRLPLTGGKDSRAILAALLGSDTLSKLDHLALRAPPEHPDAVVAGELAARCGVPLRLHGMEELLERPLLEQLRMHLFRSECRLHSWDVKAEAERKGLLSLGGHFGELYRSHFTGHLMLGWQGMERLLGVASQVNQHGVLTAEAAHHIQVQVRGWIEHLREQHVPVWTARDQWHRQARMWQWAADAARADGVGQVLMAPLGSGRLVAGYDRQTLWERRAERTHFELMQVGPEWLWRHRFAQASWRRELMVWMRRPITPGLEGVSSWPHASRQYLMWERHKEEARALLLDAPGAGSAFYEVFDREGVARLLARYEAGAPDGFLLKGIFGVLGARLALGEGVRARPIAG